MYVYTIKDSGSSRFTECTSIKIHRTFFSVHHDSWTPKMVNHSVTKIKLAPTPFKGFIEKLGW